MKITVDPGSAVPLYRQVKDALRARITSGELRPGDMLPGEVALARELGLSRLTVHRALRELVAEGLLLRRRAVGTIVGVPRRDKVLVEGPLFSLSEELAQEGAPFSNRILVQEIVPAGEHVAADLGLTPGDPAVHLVSLRTVAGLPFALEDMRYAYERFPRMATLDLNDRSTYAALQAEYNAHPEQAVDHITAGRATPLEARWLGLKRGAPVLRVERLSYDAKGRPVESTVATFLADRYRIVARVSRRALHGWGATGTPPA